MAEKQYRVRFDTRIEDDKYKSNQVIIIDSSVGDKYKKESGALDDNKHAVEYALTLGEPIKHKTKAGNKPQQIKKG